ncbi:hypothetical protein ACHWQZ_G000054 [Mnemiopsis leidyi]
MTKCCFVHFQPKFTYDETCARTRPFTLGKDESRSIFINGQEIKKVSSTKFLGIIIDENLNWNAHRDHLVKKLRSTTGAISRITKSIPSEYYKDIYSSLFESHLGYGITVWGATLQEKSCDRRLGLKAIIPPVNKNSQLSVRSDYDSTFRVRAAQLFNILPPELRATT